MFVLDTTFTLDYHSKMLHTFYQRYPVGEDEPDRTKRREKICF